MLRAPVIEFDLVFSSAHSKIYLKGSGRTAQVEFDSLSGAWLLFHSAYTWLEPLNRFLELTGYQVQLLYRGRQIKSLDQGSHLLRLLRWAKFS